MILTYRRIVRRQGKQSLRSVFPGGAEHSVEQRRDANYIAHRATRRKRETKDNRARFHFETGRNDREARFFAVRATPLPACPGFRDRNFSNRKTRRIPTHTDEEPMTTTRVTCGPRPLQMAVRSPYVCIVRVGSVQKGRKKGRPSSLSAFVPSIKKCAVKKSIKRN